MLVVSDATPVNILVRLSLVELLHDLFDSVAIPTSVAQEMSHPATPELVREWMAAPPPWLSVITPSGSAGDGERKHRGERDAILLAQEIKADAILLDEIKPRMEAMRLGLAVIGTVGILERAADAGLIDNLAKVHDDLCQTDFHVRRELLAASLERHRRHRR